MASYPRSNRENPQSTNFPEYAVFYEDPSEVDRMIKEDTLNDDDFNQALLETSINANEGEKMFFMVVDKSKYEKVTDYKDKYPMLRFRKKLLLIKL
jgi:hypothetical protein